MSLAQDLYPKSVANVPPDLTLPSPSYRREVRIVLASLITFVLFYLALVAAAGWFFWFCITYSLGESSRGAMLLKIGSVLLSGMLFVFLVKGLFKFGGGGDDLQIEITERDHPELFAFIRRLCEETKAPFPHRVFLSPEVNAAVFYNRTFWSLFFPVKKNLLIGLGLVNMVNLGEFKSVLAHEFGHFSQSSMALGSYVYRASQVIVDMVFARDAFDDWLARWRRTDFRIAIFGHALYGVVWVLRKILAGAFHGINFLNARLSREMEFHADLVAVSVSGSDLAARMLYPLEFAGEALGQAMEDIRAAADHRLYTRDLFFHQLRAADYLRRVRSEPQLGIAPPIPAEGGHQQQLFQPGEGGIPSMYASHPSNHDREKNAKRVYIPSAPDERSPWLLFRNPAAVREAMTRKIYHEALHVPEQAPLAEPEQVQAFIDEEHAETTYDARYHGLYDTRFLDITDAAALARAVEQQPWPYERIASLFTRLYGGGLKEWVEKHQERQGERALLHGLESGELRLKGKTFEFRGQQQTMGDLPALKISLERELEADDQWLRNWDAAVFQAHYQMARQLGSGADRELLARYQFHLGSQEVLRAANIQRHRLEGLLEYIHEQGKQLSQEDFEKAVRALNDIRGELSGAYARAGSLALPPLSNVQPGAPLAQFLLQEPVTSMLPPDTKQLSGQWIGQLARQIATVQDKARRIHFKSLGAILSLQERVAGEWRNWVAASGGGAA